MSGKERGAGRTDADVVDPSGDSGVVMVLDGRVGNHVKVIHCKADRQARLSDVETNQADLSGQAQSDRGAKSQKRNNTHFPIPPPRVIQQRPDPKYLDRHARWQANRCRLDQRR